jgi:hypothetical protein
LPSTIMYSRMAASSGRPEAEEGADGMREAPTDRVRPG